jgi:hypothetical protein
MFAVWASPLDAERILDDPGGSVAVVAVDRLLEKVSHGTPSLQLFQQPIPAIPPRSLQQPHPG